MKAGVQSDKIDDEHNFVRFHDFWCFYFPSYPEDGKRLIITVDRWFFIGG